MSLISGIAYFKTGDVKKEINIEIKVHQSELVSSYLFLPYMALSCNLEALEALQPLV